MSLIQELANMIYDDKETKSLVYELEKSYINYLLDIMDYSKTLKNNLYTLLSISSVLCCSKEALHKNLSLKIIGLLFEFKEIRADSYFKMNAINVFTKLGNFPSMNLVEGWEEILPGLIELKYNYYAKEIIQESPLDYTFTDSQYAIYTQLLKKSSYSFSGSTSFGKSFIFKCFIKHLVDKKVKNIVFLVPTKALINQITNDLRTIVSFDSNYKVCSLPRIPKLNHNNNYIFVFTPERLISYFNETDYSSVEYLFIDESHKILSSSDSRAPILYHAISLAKQKGAKLFFASPNVSNPDIFHKLFSDDLNKNYAEISTNIKESPVTQNRFFIDTIRNVSFMISDFGNDINMPKFEFGDDHIKNLKIVLDKFSKSNEQNIIYCNTKEKTIKTALEFAKTLQNVDSKEILDCIDFIKEKIHIQYFLIECLEKGVAFHLGQMPEDVKFYVESLFKKGHIKFLFCTSTLLEGVNLPAKNIFILSENIGNSKMKQIDFWNLAGRAGRLAKEISGNIFCVNIFDQKGYWKNEKKLSLLRDREIKEMKSNILSNKNNTLYKSIDEYISNKNESNETISKTYGNIIVYQLLSEQTSVLKKNFISLQKNKIDLKDVFELPYKVLSNGINIDIHIQNELFKKKIDNLPIEPNFENCKKVLDLMYYEYKWNEINLKNKNSLVYFATIMNKWINSTSLNEIINSTLSYYENNDKEIFSNSYNKKKRKPFDKNDKQDINNVITNLMDTIEIILKFHIKKYISNYQELIKYKNNQDDLENDWAKFIEYGTKDKEIINLQDLGLTRELSHFILKNYRECLIRDKNIIIDINHNLLMQKINQTKFKSEYNQLKLLWNLD
ncbi:DEAD/DEAH box helicase [Mycoplasma capricolum subsp. capricolum]|uniref:DEAD/DEAH box helicase n=1 Tax=Mycoplasma capricolum TaxID=2095 RepID=UPI003DA32360